MTAQCSQCRASNTVARAFLHHSRQADETCFGRSKTGLLGATFGIKNITFSFDTLEMATEDVIDTSSRTLWN